MSHKGVLNIIGPTAVGKTDLAVRLAERIDGEIISSDSRLLYRGMDIGTAKPSLEEMKRIKHHMIDLALPDQIWSLSQYQGYEKKVILDILNRNRCPIIVGGTGQYFRALTEGWVIPAQKPDPNMRLVLERWVKEIGPEELFKKLKLVDPKAAEKIDANNSRRVIRALEVIFGTGHLFSEQKEKAPSEFSFKTIGLTRPRDELYRRVDERIEQMFESGFLEEVQKLLGNGYTRDLPSLSAIGYKEVACYLEGEYSLEEAKVLMRRKTREFIRRQANWFKLDDPKIEWYEMTPDPLDRIEKSVRDWLSLD